MPDGLDFTFTVPELFAAFRLAMPDAEARTKAAEVVQLVEGGARDWATSEQVLLLLAIGSESGHLKVEHIRRAVQEARYELWRKENVTQGGREEDLRWRWNEIVASEDRAWAAQRSELERSLRQEGRLPPEA